MAKQAGRLGKLLRSILQFKGLRKLLRAAELLRLLRGAQTRHVVVSKPNRNSLWGLGRYHDKASGTPSQAAAEGFMWFKGIRKLLRGF